MHLSGIFLYFFDEYAQFKNNRKHSLYSGKVQCDFIHWRHSFNMLGIAILLFFCNVKLFFSQDIRTLTLSELIDTKYQCTSLGCSPSILSDASNLRDCQLSCIAATQCRTLTFDFTDAQCELFVDIPEEFGTLLSQSNVITMIASDSRESSARELK